MIKINTIDLSIQIKQFIKKALIPQNFDKNKKP